MGLLAGLGMELCGFERAIIITRKIFNSLLQNKRTWSHPRTVDFFHFTLQFNIFHFKTSGNVDLSNSHPLSLFFSSQFSHLCHKTQRELGHSLFSKAIFSRLICISWLEEKLFFFSCLSLFLQCEWRVKFTFKLEASRSLENTKSRSETLVVVFLDCKYTENKCAHELWRTSLKRHNVNKIV